VSDYRDHAVEHSPHGHGPGSPGRARPSDCGPNRGPPEPAWQHL